MATGPELVVGLVGAIGAELDALVHSLKDAFAAVRYECTEIRLIDALLMLPAWKETPTEPLDHRYHARMSAGNDLRRQLKRSDALALLGMASIRHARRLISGDETKQAPRRVYILRSLKTPAEVARLRAVYGPNAYVISAYSSKANRQSYLSQRIADSHKESTNQEKYAAHASELIRRDEMEHGDDYGQAVRDTFPLADLFVDLTCLAKIGPAEA